MSNQQLINCPNCYKLYKKKGSYENHIFKCGRKEENIELTNEKLLDLIHDLTNKYNNIQLELTNIKSSINRKNKKLKVLDYLNEYVKNDNNFIHKIEINRDDLLIIFDKGFVKGIGEILYNKLSELDNIKCFNEKKNVIYVVKDNKWEELENESWESLIKYINSQILVLFKEYQDENMEHLEDEKNHKVINNYLTKILCVEISFETKCNRIKTNLYTKLKIGFKNIVELQIE
jgi:hypothetical protein|uniref:Uncharacterized protein n=1 Tax=viral metagenome TaxID=1070528 RepID=A0A6C0CJB0_9ZZZZ